MKKLAAIIFGLFLLSTAYAAVPHLINYQGRLTDKNSAPLNALYNLTFRIYDAESAGTLLWQGAYNNVSITKGIFNILLGDVNDTGFNFTNLAFDKPYWLEIKVGTEIMSPRQRITSSGYAISAENADKVKAEGVIGAFKSSSLPAGSVVQVVNTQTGTAVSGTTPMPIDSTVPQKTEGDEYMALTITPTSATNKLKIDVVFFGSNSTASSFAVALFQDNAANALAVGAAIAPNSSHLTCLKFTYYTTAGTASPITFKVRAGSQPNATTFFNRDDYISNYFGGLLASSITITEIKN